MKGITHFTVGLAVTSFFPAALNAAVAGRPWYFMLGGAAALLPDTLDFKLLRFLYRHDREIAPSASAPDAAEIAAAVADTIETAASTGRPVSIKLNTIPMAGNYWRQYKLGIDPLNRRVAVVVGPVVSTSQTIVDASPPAGHTATAGISVEAFPSYMADVTVDILDGPVLEMQPCPDGRVRMDFIPWHRSKTHSLAVGLMLGLVVAIFGGVVAGMIFCAAYTSHILTDQLGFMGSNLWYPFTRRRTKGCLRLHAMNPRANAATVWTALLLILWNLSRSAGTDFAYSLPRLLFFGLALPLLGLRMLKACLRDGR